MAARTRPPPWGAHVRLHRYYLPKLPNWEDTWSVVYVDQSGILSIVSDWGDFAYTWGTGGRSKSDFREELLRFGSDYVANKLYDHGHMVLDEALTVKVIREHILHLRKVGALTAEQARSDWNDSKGIESYSAFQQFLDDDLDHNRHDAYCECCSSKPHNSASVDKWIQKSWPRLRAAMQAELEAEKRLVNTRLDFCVSQPVRASQRLRRLVRWYSHD